MGICIAYRISPACDARSDVIHLSSIKAVIFNSVNELVCITEMWRIVKL